MTIFKYDLPGEFGTFSLPLPKGAEVLHVAEQYDNGSLWAVVDASAKIEQRDFIAVATGGQVPKNGTHLGSYTVLGGKRVYHIFEVMR